MSASSSPTEGQRASTHDSDSDSNIDKKAPARPSTPEQQSPTEVGPSSSGQQWKGKQPARGVTREQAISPESAPFQRGRYEPEQYRRLLPAGAPAGSIQDAEAHVFLGTLNYALRKRSPVEGYEGDYVEDSGEDDEMPDLEDDAGSDDVAQRGFGVVVESGNDVKYAAEWGGEVDIDAQIAMMRQFEDAKEEEQRLRPRRQAPKPPVAGSSKRDASGSPGEGPISPTKRGRS